MDKIELIKADITKLNIDAIVNAANRSLLGGGGVDGAIHNAAGFQLTEECKTLDGCETGQSKITKGYNLPAKYVIHTVGPVWHGGDNDETELLNNCYKSSLDLALEYNIRTIAFPNISTGVYRFPKIIASGIAINTVRKYLENYDRSFDKIIFAVFDDENYAIYQEKLSTYPK